MRWAIPTRFEFIAGPIELSTRGFQLADARSKSADRTSARCGAGRQRARRKRYRRSRAEARCPRGHSSSACPTVHEDATLTHIPPISSVTFEVSSSAGPAISYTEPDQGPGPDRSSYPLSAAGDVNGDGVSDVIIGAPHADHRDQFRPGESYVVFGRAARSLSNGKDVVRGVP